jgi:hypothetical protein
MIITDPDNGFEIPQGSRKLQFSDRRDPLIRRGEAKTVHLSAEKSHGVVPHVALRRGQVKSRF